MLLKDPVSGPIMEGTGGIRKVRFPPVSYTHLDVYKRQEHNDCDSEEADK